MNVLAWRKKIIIYIERIIAVSILYCICGNGNCYAAIVKDIDSCSKLNSAFSNVAANQEYIFNISKNFSVSADDSNARKLNKAGAVVTIVASGGNRTVTSANMGQGCIHDWFRWEKISPWLRIDRASLQAMPGC